MFRGAVLFWGPTKGLQFRELPNYTEYVSDFIMHDPFHPGCIPGFRVSGLRTSRWGFRGTAY